jgi:hypothetical protein
MYRLGRMTRRVCDQAARLLRAAGQYLRDARRKPRTDKPEGLTLRIIVRVEVVK